MRHSSKLIIILSFASLISFGQKKIDVAKEFAFATQQYDEILKTHPDITKTPHRD